MNKKITIANSSLLIPALLFVGVGSSKAEEQNRDGEDILNAGKSNIAGNTLVVTSTREARSKSELPESISVISREEINAVSPSHPSEILNRIPGVHVNNLGGEGHMSSIRQPITTAGVYLFLEDGIPTRPSGFFNHNGLYEVNIPQSNGIEVIKGTGSALYGSDAIGGIINTITRDILQNEETEFNLELGSHDYKRGLLSYGTMLNNDSGLRFDLNVTDNDGYRDSSNYSRQSLNVRYDNQLNDQWKLKTVFAASRIDQSGTSSLEELDYLNTPKKNLYQDGIAFRDVEAFRLSAEFSYEPNDKVLWTITPYFRDNQMVMMPSWMVTYDPNIRDNQFQTYGSMFKYRNHINEDWVLILGIDAETTPSEYREEMISLTQEDDVYVGYAETGDLNYDFEATQNILSTYVHTELDITTELLLSFGVRYDYFEVDYDDRLTSEPLDPSHYRPESQTVDFDNASPKLGLVYQLSDRHNIYVNYRYSFVAPSVGRLFRPGSSLESERLEPVKGKSYEIGFRGQWEDNWQYELAFYQLNKEDDIVTFIDGSDRKVTNAGETSHKGLEVGLQGDITEQFRLNIAWTWTEQKYEEFGYLFQCFSPACGRVIPGPPIRENRNFAGFDIGKAPKSLGNLSVQYFPSAFENTRLELEYEHVGSYFTDETNTQKYDGHQLLNFRMNHELSMGTDLYLRIMNLQDERYSTYTSNQVGDSDISYRPGLPRSYFLGMRFKF